MPDRTSKTDADAGGDTIVFLCPNGHKLNGPASLQGKPGQCPHCKERFVIPDYSEDEEQEPEPDQGEGSQVQEDPIDDSTIRGIDPPGVDDALEDLNQLGDLDDLDSLDPLAAAAAPMSVGLAVEDDVDGGAMPDEDIVFGAHPLAGLFESFWDQRGDDGTVQLILKSSEVVTPEFFAPMLSEQDYGVFAYRAEDGSYTMCAITWDAIAQVVLRGVKKLPGGEFRS